MAHLSSRPPLPHRRRRTSAVSVATCVVAALVAPLATAAPPVAPHVVVAQPTTDGVVLEGYSAGVPLTVQIMRGGVLVASQSVTPAAEPGGGGGGGGGAAAVVGEVNGAEGGACWPGRIPDITYGDIVRVLGPGGTVEDSTVQNLTVGPTVDSAANQVTVSGTATALAGGQLTLDGLEQRLNSAGFSDQPFRRVLGGEGALTYTGPGSTAWDARFTFTGPNAATDKLAALSAQSVASWTSAGGTEVTEAEAGAIGGAQGTCSGPLVTNAATSTTPASYVFDSTTLTIGGIAALDVTAVDVAVSDANPFTPDVVAPATLQTTGGGQSWSVTLSQAQVRTLTDGTLTITPTFPIAGAPLTITKNMVPPDLTPPVASITSGPKPFAGSTAATFVFSSTEPGRFECALDAGAFVPCQQSTVFIGLTPGTHSLRLRAVDPAGNTSPEVSRSWVVDLTAPILTPSIRSVDVAALLTRGVPTVTARCNERCALTVRTRLVVNGSSIVSAARAATTGRAGVNTKVRAVTLRPAQLRRLRAALRSGVAVRIVATVSAVDRAGNQRKQTLTTRVR